MTLGDQTTLTTIQSMSQTEIFSTSSQEAGIKDNGQ